MDATRVLLLKLANEPNNAFCADCGAPEPRWASWNLGVFICMRCAGIHRKMGTHVSKVKSLQLDHWTEEQVKAFTNSGCNSQSRRVYEALLPDSYIRPQSESALENFIRAKYEQRKFYKPAVSSTEKPKPTSPILSPASQTTPEANLIDLETDSCYSASTHSNPRDQRNALLLCFGDPSESQLQPSRTGNSSHGLITMANPPTRPQFPGFSTTFNQPPPQHGSNYLNQVTQQLAAIKAQTQSGKFST